LIHHKLSVKAELGNKSFRERAGISTPTVST